MCGSRHCAAQIQDQCGISGALSVECHPLGPCCAESHPHKLYLAFMTECCCGLRLSILGLCLKNHTDHLGIFLLIPGEETVGMIR